MKKLALLVALGLFAVVPRARATEAPPFLQEGETYEFGGIGSGRFTARVREVSSAGWVRLEVDDQPKAADGIWLNLGLVPTIRWIDREEVERRKRLEPTKKTMADMRAIATSCEAYAVDNDVYPSTTGGSIRDLSPIVTPVYIRKLPTKDGWGNELEYWSEGGQHYWVISRGPDGERESELYTAAGRPKTGLDPKVCDEDADDIVFHDGQFVRYPEESETPADDLD